MPFVLAFMVSSLRFVCKTESGILVLREPSVLKNPPTIFITSGTCTLIYLLTCAHDQKEIVHKISGCAVPVQVYLFVCFAGVLGSGGMLIIITTALIKVGFIIIKRKHASKKAGDWGVN